MPTDMNTRNYTQFLISKPISILITKALLALTADEMWFLAYNIDDKKWFKIEPCEIEDRTMFPAAKNLSREKAIAILLAADYASGFDYENL